MATVGGKYVTVPTFSAREGEDPDRWLERFEEAASYNNWNPERTLKNVYIALDGPAKAWGNRLKASAVRPTVWSSVAVAEAQTAADRAGDPDAPVVAPGPHGFREFFIEEFISATHHVSIGTKLSRRVQGPTESPVNYYHDVMDLCDKKNSLMSDKERLEYIFSGLEKELAERIVRMKPRTPHDVLEELRAEEYAEKLVGMHSRVRGAEASVSAVSTSTYAAFERKATPEVKQPPRATAENSSSDVQELKSMVSQLIKTIAETQSSPGRRRQGRFLPNRNEKGEPRCYDCDNYGHMARDCPKKSKNQTVQPAASTSGSAQKPDSKKKEVSQITLAEIDQISVYDEQEDGSRRFRFQFNNVSADHRLLLKEMASKKMLETVELQEIGSCRKKKTSCLLDTGSDLTIVSPEWCEEMKAKVTPWEGPHLWMANATPADVIGMVEISVANERGRACGSALVMKLNGYELLMGNNFLRQFKSLSIRYHEKGHEIILGEELPVEAAVISADKCRVQMLRGKLIPKQSIVRVAVAVIGTDEKQEAASAWVLTPANHLLERKNLAAAHSILPGPFPTAVYVANLSNRDEWLPKRACIGYIESAQIQVEGEEKEEKVDTKQESEILLTRGDLEKQFNCCHPRLDSTAAVESSLG